MPQAQIIRAWTENGKTHLAVRVAGDGPGTTDVEYIGTVDNADLQGLSGAQQKAALIAAVKAERDRSKGATLAGASDIAGITGIVTL